MIAKFLFQRFDVMKNIISMSKFPVEILSIIFLMLFLPQNLKAAANDTKIEDGTYIGAYDCNNGRSYSYAIFEILPNTNGTQGKFSFEFGDISGSYFVSVTKSGSEFKLAPTHWERQPKGFFYTNIFVYDVGGDLEGRIAAQGCGRIYLTRNRSAAVTTQSIDQLKKAGFQLLEAHGYFYATIAPAGYRGIEHPYDPKRAIGHYEQACNGGAVGGCMALATAFKNGKYITEDKPRANMMFTKMCNDGFGVACTEIIFPQTTFEYKPGNRVTLTLNGWQDRNQKLCFSGNGDACANFSASLFRATNNKETLLYARFVAEHGCTLKSTTSCYNAGSFYDNDDSAPGNQGKARAFFGTACNLGYNDGCAEIRRRDASDERKNRVVNRKIDPMTCVSMEKMTRTVTEIVTDKTYKDDFKEVKTTVPDGYIVRNSCGGDISITSKLGVTADIKPARDDFFINVYFALLAEGDKVVSAKWINVPQN